MKDLENHDLGINGVYEWSNTTSQIMTQQPSNTPALIANEMILKSLYEKEFCKVSIENASMEADYKDIMSIEFEENVTVSIRELSPNKNQLSSLSPHSMR